MEISSLSNKLVIYANSLKEKKYRDKEGKFLIEGEHLVEMADNIEAIFTTNKDYTFKDVPIYYVNEAIIKKLSFVESSQGIVAIVKKKQCEIDYSKDRYLICDYVSDPGNLGTIIRTCLAFNVNNIILANGSVDVYNDKVIRGSQGAIFKVNIIYDDLFEVIKKLNDNNVDVYASTLASDSINLTDIKKVNKFALIVGNEGSGIRKEIQQASNYRVKIAHSDKIDSLNVGVASSIMLYYFDLISR